MVVASCAVELGSVSGSGFHWLQTSCGSFRNYGYLIWRPYNKDPTIWGAILRSPIFGKLPCVFIALLHLKP